MTKQNDYLSKSNDDVGAGFCLLFFLPLIYFLIKYFVPLLIGIFFIIGTVMLIKHGAQENSSTEPLDPDPIDRLRALQKTIITFDEELKVYDRFKEQEDYQNVERLAKKFLPQLAQMRTEIEDLKEHVPDDDYQRITKNIALNIDEFTLKLSQLDELIATAEKKKQLKLVALFAPELLTTYQNIRKDDTLIREKIVSHANPAEQTALQDSRMKHFEEIIDAYLDIKQAPKNYHNAEKRLATSKETLEQFDLELDQVLQELNEEKMRQLDVNLRLLNNPKQDNTSI
jgi:hypothetical protein